MYRISIPSEDIEKMPMVSFDGPISVITREGPEYRAAINYLKSQELIGFDTETRPTFTPRQRSNGVALLQLSGGDKAFLFRVQSLGMPQELRDIMASTDILKIGAASHDDVRGLQKYAPFRERGFIDLQKIVWQWGIRDKSVKKMAAIILGIRISKTQQLSNWEAETLSESQRKYAATDAWVCREMYLKLIGSEKKPLSKEEINPPQLQPRKAAEPATSQHNTPVQTAPVVETGTESAENQ